MLRQSKCKDTGVLLSKFCKVKVEVRHLPELHAHPFGEKWHLLHCKPVPVSRLARFDQIESN